MFPMQKITIYHKTSDGWTRYNKMASYRQKSSISNDDTGRNESDSVTIRIFDFDGYNDTWMCEKGDVIVNKDIKDEIQEAPISEMSKKYGKDYVFQVQSIERNLYGEDLDHIKIECK